jgi:hypothetical protein
MQRIANERLATAAEAGKRLQELKELERETLGLSSAILDTTTNLREVLAERDRSLKPSTAPVTKLAALDERQRQAAERWETQRVVASREATRETATSREKALILPGHAPEPVREQPRLLDADGHAL